MTGDGKGFARCVRLAAFDLALATTALKEFPQYADAFVKEFQYEDKGLAALIGTEKTTKLINAAKVLMDNGNTAETIQRVQAVLSAIDLSKCEQISEYKIGQTIITLLDHGKYPANLKNIRRVPDALLDLKKHEAVTEDLFEDLRDIFLSEYNEGEWQARFLNLTGIIRANIYSMQDSGPETQPAVTPLTAPNCLTIVTSTNQVYISDKELDLSKSEFHILLTLSTQSNAFVSTSKVLPRALSKSSLSKTISVLRKKLGKVATIKAKSKAGYRINIPPDKIILKD